LIKKFLITFDTHAQHLRNQDAKGETRLKDLLSPVPGKMQQHQQDLDSFLEKHVIIPADKCRGNYIIVCRNLYIKQFVNSLHQAPEYNRLQISKEDRSARLLQEITGLVHDSHLAVLPEKGKIDLPYLYTMPKPHNNPFGWHL
jgi:hypothetical protein